MTVGNSESQRRYVEAGMFLLLFAFFFLFFTQIHALVVFDSDDWMYISFARTPLPSLREWNPTRIFPECFAPLTGYFAAYVLAPLVGDYLRALTYAAGWFLSMMLTGYFYFFYRLICEDGRSSLRAFCVTAVFFALHFYLLKSQPYDNLYMFWTYNFTCVFYYLMPLLLNASLVLWLMRRGRLTEVYAGSTSARKGILWVWLYFAIFSSIFHNIVLISFLVLYSLWDFLQGEEKHDVRAWAWKHRIEILVLLVWLACLFFEAHGGRAKDIGKDFFHMPWRETVDQARLIWPAMKHSAVNMCIFVLLLAGAGLFHYRRDSQERRERILLALSLWSAVLIFIYLFLVCTKVNPVYFVRADVAFSYFFYFLLATGLALNYLIRRHPSLEQIMPLVAVFAVMMALNHPKESFRESTVENVPPQVCYELSRDLVRQMVVADQAGENHPTIHVIVGTGRNWPQSDMMPKVLSEALFRHGILSRFLEFDILPDAEMNQKYHLPAPLQTIQKNPHPKM